MLLHDSNRTPIFVFPAVATTAVILFLLRYRQITDGSSPGSGVTIVGAELFGRLSALVHAALSIGAQGDSLLLRIATAPLVFVLTTLESEFRLGLGAIDGVSSFLGHAAVYLIQAL